MPEEKKKNIVRIATKEKGRFIVKEVIKPIM